MQKKKKDWETLRDTGMLGAYQPEEVSLQELPSGEILSLFSDTELWEYPGQLVRKREMVIGGKVFHIASVFQGGRKPLLPLPANCSPTSTGSCKKTPVEYEFPMDFGRPVWYPVVAVPACPGKGGSKR